MVKKKSKTAYKPITAAIAKKVLKVVDAGLVAGMSDAKPGQMCVEAAVCYAMGEPHSDRPKCVTEAIRDFKMALNDHSVLGDISSETDATRKKRSKALRKIAIAQLGTKGVISDDAFKYKLFCLWLKREGKLTEYKKAVERHKLGLEKALESLKAGELVDVVAPAAIQTDFNGFDPECLHDEIKTEKELKKLIKDTVQILIDLGSPGSKYLYLTE